MSINWFLWGTFVLYQKCVLAAQDDLDTAAITVYRNPEFFRHLSKEFNNHLSHYANDKPPYGPTDEYQSPYLETSHDDFPESHQGFLHTSGEYSDADSPSDDDANFQEANSSSDDNGNFQEENADVESEKEDIRDQENYSEDERAEQRDPVEEDGDVYKYPGEPKKPNAPGRPVFTHFDRSPDFHHPPRNVPFPNKPKKKGRGPYGHPRVSNSNRSYGDNGDVNLNYSEDYEDSRSKSEEEQLAEIEEENRKKKVYNDDDHQPLSIYHNGQRYPVNIKPYREHVEPLHDDFPLGHYDDYHQYPPTEDYHPAAQNVYYPRVTEEFKPVHKFPVEPLIETKKGTREFLKFNKYPPNHELQDITEPVTRKTPNRQIVSCNTLIRPKKPKKYVAYRVRPLYSHYRVVPVYYRKPVPIFKRSAKAKVRSKKFHKINPVEDDSAYLLNSEFDQDYQNIRVTKKKRH